MVNEGYNALAYFPSFWKTQQARDIYGCRKLLQSNTQILMSTLLIIVTVFVFIQHLL